MPFAELLQYRHCAFRAANLWTITPDVTLVTETAERLLATPRRAVQF